MRSKSSLLLLALTLGFIGSCGVMETEEQATVENTILKLIDAEGGDFGFEGFENAEELEFDLAKSLVPAQSDAAMETENLRDSSYIWRFGRREMHREREVSVEQEDDSSALALISDHITGMFHVRQFERVWTSDSTWGRGDSVQFSQKPIDMVLIQRVAFRKRIGPNGNERWIPAELTLARGASDESMSIQGLNWMRGDSVFSMSLDEDTFFPAFGRHVVKILRARRVGVVVSNTITDGRESVHMKFDFVPRDRARVIRKRAHLRYTETLDSGENVYLGRVPHVDRPLRHVKGFMEVLDQRTLFDHSYGFYTSSILTYSYRVPDFNR